jgi:hypothetical protein
MLMSSTRPYTGTTAATSCVNAVSKVLMYTMLHSMCEPLLLLCSVVALSPVLATAESHVLSQYKLQHLRRTHERC